MSRKTDLTKALTDRRLVRETEAKEAALPEDIWTMILNAREDHLQTADQMSHEAEVLLETAQMLGEHLGGDALNFRSPEVEEVKKTCSRSHLGILGILLQHFETQAEVNREVTERIQGSRRVLHGCLAALGASNDPKDYKDCTDDGDCVKKLS